MLRLSELGVGDILADELGQGWVDTKIDSCIKYSALQWKPFTPTIHSQNSQEKNPCNCVHCLGLHCESPGPFIIVAPLATLPYWVHDFWKWCPSLPVACLAGTTTERESIYSSPLNPMHREKKSNFPMIITSYEVAIQEEWQLNKVGEFKYLVINEEQGFKNHRCTLICSLKMISSVWLLLNGNLIQDDVGEISSLLNFSTLSFITMPAYHCYCYLLPLKSTRLQRRNR